VVTEMLEKSAHIASCQDATAQKATTLTTFSEEMGMSVLLLPGLTTNAWTPLSNFQIISFSLAPALLPVSMSLLSFPFLYWSDEIPSQCI